MTKSKGGRPTKQEVLKEAIIAEARNFYSRGLPLPIDLIMGDLRALKEILPETTNVHNYIKLLPATLDQLVLQNKLIRVDNGISTAKYQYNPHWENPNITILQTLDYAEIQETLETLTSWARTEVLQPLRALVNGTTEDKSRNRFGRVLLLKAIIKNESREELEAFIKEQEKRIAGYQKILNNLPLIQSLKISVFTEGDYDLVNDFIETWGEDV